MTRYRKKPVEVDAIRWDGVNIDAAIKFIAPNGTFDHLPDDGASINKGVGFTPAEGTLHIPTLEGVMTASPGDWIICGVKGEYYPCKPDIFEATYEKVTA